MTCLQVKLEVLQGVVHSLEDWVVIADSDELHDYTTMGGTAAAMVEAAKQQHANWVLGVLVDRVSESGNLTSVRMSPSIFVQFPHNCDVVKTVANGYPWKVVAAKAYWRTNTGNHFVVPPKLARQYFGAAQMGERNLRWGFDVCLMHRCRLRASP